MRRTRSLQVVVSVVLGLGAAVWSQAVPAVLANPGFETNGGWEIVPQKGAAGAGEMDAGKACAGARSMKLTKTNAVGSLVLRSAQPVKLEPNVRYTCRFRFHAEDATLANLLLLRINTAKDQTLGYNSIDQSAGWMSQSLLINSPAGKWEKRVGHYQVLTNQPAEVYINVALYGNPCTVWLDDFELVPDDYKVAPISSNFQNACTPGQLAEILKARPEATAQVTAQDGRGALLVNGKPVPPVIYKVIGDGDYLRFGQAEVNLETVSVRLGNTRGDPGVWLGKDKYDFALAETSLQKALLRNPQANVILDVLFFPYPEWGAENPGECWTDDKGRRGYGTWANRDGFADDLSKLPPDARQQYWWYPSYNSQQWREDAGKAAAALIGHLRQTPYGKTIAGYFISGGHDGQFQVFGSFDYSTGNRRRFGQWLRAKYGTIANLQTAWGKSAPASFEDAAIPPPIERADSMENGAPYLNPGPASDYRDYAAGEAWALRDVFSKAVKDAAGKPVFTIAYGDPTLYNFQPMMNLKYLDASAAMSYYPYRNNGYALGFKPVAAFPLHNKLLFQELDTRSWAGSMSDDEVYEMWIGAGLKPADWQNINRKLAGFSLADQTGFWYYDMNHFFDAPEIMDEIGKVYRETARLRSRKPSSFRPDVCVVQAGGQAKFLNSDYSSINSSHFYQLMAMEQSGVPYDLHNLADVLSRPELQQYKVYVFYQTRYLATAERQAIKQKLQCGGKTLVWMHDDGYLSETGKSVAAQSDLLGMQVRTEEKYARLTPLTVPDQTLTRGVHPFLGLNEVIMQIMAQEGPSCFTARAQPFWIVDPAATPFAKFAEDGLPAGAIRKMNGWTSVYLAAPNSLTGDLLNSIAQQAGAYVCGAAGQSIAMNGNFLSLHGMQNGEYVVNLPKGVRKVTDVASGKDLPVVKGKCNLQVEAQKTYWLELE